VDALTSHVDVVRLQFQQQQQQQQPRLHLEKELASKNSWNWSCHLNSVNSATLSIENRVSSGIVCAVFDLPLAFRNSMSIKNR